MLERLKNNALPAPKTGPFGKLAFTRKHLMGAKDDTTADPVAFKALVASLFSSPGSIIPGMVGCILTPLICWATTKDPVFLIFTAVVAGAVAIRLVVALAYWSSNHANDQPATTRLWERAFTASASLVSATLGANSYYALTYSADESAHVIAVSANIAIASAFVARNAARPHFVVLQTLFFCLPVAASLIQSPNPYFVILGFFTLFYMYCNVAVVFSVHRNLLAMVSATKKSDELAKKLQTQNAVLDAALNNMSLGLAMFNQDMNLAVANRRHAELYQLSANSLPPTLRATVLQLAHSGVITHADALTIDAAAQKVLRANSPTAHDITTSAGGNYVVTFTPAADQGVVMLTEDATQRKAAAAKIEKLARFDTLTGLANRYEITQVIENAFQKVATGDHRFAVLFIDLDGFKVINDTMGHEIGDKLLVAVARRITEFGADKNVFGRLGGDEFIAILSRATRDQALATANNIIGRLTDAFTLDGRQIRVSATIGVALAPEHALNADHLLRNADLALYRAKSKGRGGAAIYSEALSTAFSERHAIETDLRNAVAANAFEMYYQPIVELRTQKIVGHEALMRWPHPNRGIVSPELFIPIAEETGLIDKIGCFAITQSCRDAASWPGERSISVNVSPIQFRNPELLVNAVVSALASSKLNPGRLILEMTESALICGATTTLETMKKIADLGVRFAVDDFGVGYSSLSILSDFPFSFLKIDRSLSCEIGVDKTRYAIVEAVCQLSRKINLDVVVEGIETSEQRLVFQLMGASRGQGWLFGKPAPAGDISTELRARQIA